MKPTLFTGLLLKKETVGFLVRPIYRIAFTLLELTITVAIFSILVASVYLFFLNQKDVVDSSIEHNRIETNQRLALDEIEEFIQNAGLRAYSVGEDWHPILHADSTAVTFIADISGRGNPGLEDTLTLSRDGDGMLTVTDAAGNVVYHGSVQGRMIFTYFDSNGDEIMCSELDGFSYLDRIRQIQFTIEVGAEGEGRASRISSPPNLVYSVL